MRMHIFEYLFRLLNNKLKWLRHERKLNSMKEMEQFQKYIIEVQPKEFLIYQKASPEKRLEFASVINELGVNLKDTRLLDIGPAYGDSLDIGYESGANCIEFVETNPFFFTYNRLKKYTKGYQINHLIRLNKLHPMKYDLIWIKGSVIADHFIINDNLKIKKLLFSRWLIQIEKLASFKCQIIICPYWLNS